MLSLAAVFAAASASCLHAAPRIGRAVVAHVSGAASFRGPETTSHEFPSATGAIVAGMALSEPQTIETGKDGRLCLVMTPGAIVCVAPNTTLKLVKLELATEGLPESEKDLLKRIVLELDRGGILVHAGVPSPLMAIEVRTPVGTVKTAGGDFVVRQDGEGWQVGAQKYGASFAYGDKQAEVAEGRVLRASRPAGGDTQVAFDTTPASDLAATFDMCQIFFGELDGYVFLPDGADTGRLAGWIGGASGVVATGDPTVWDDVSPTLYTPPVQGQVPRPAPAAAPAPGGKWGRDEIWKWYRQIGAIRGVNYLPRTAINPTELWQKDTFDADTIRQELGWAHDAGYNSIRVGLQYLVWKQDPKGFKDRLGDFLDMAGKAGLTVVFVLFDDTRTSGRDPFIGKQPDPVPGVYNSGWTPSPAADQVASRTEWADLEKYVKDVVGAFKRDRRILFWDLYQTPGNAGLGDRSLALLESAFRWARAVKPRQPLTAGPWTDFGSPMSVRIMDLSDVVTIQTFDDAEGVRNRILACKALDRPVMCTDWLKRTSSNTFDQILPIFAKDQVGWYSRGLVRGKAQWYVPAGVATAQPPPPVWYQDVLQEDGKPFDRREIELIQGFRFVE